MTIDLENIRQNSKVVELLPKSTRGKLPRHRPGEEFLCGPIPMNWLSKASSLGGKVLAVGLAIWFESFRKREKQPVKITKAILQRFNVGRHAGYYGLDRLEKAGLVSVERSEGKAPRVTLLEATQSGNEASSPVRGIAN